MAIHIQEEQTHQKGYLKTIDASGIAMIFDAMQKHQYSHPVKSTVREIVSNGIDSIAEKRVAIEILSGKAKVEDYFADMEGEVYRDSKFEPAYYDLNWLSNDKTVHMQYIVGPALERDKVVFSDNGVGLGGRRLEKYFSLGYSTKRLSKLPLGKFGIGAKSPLSVGVTFYTVESRYNGKLFRFNAYSMKADSIIPKMNMSTGEENGHVLFNEGTEDEYPVYYLKTEEKNGLTITLEAKKHQKQQYIDAVKQQLLYFSDIRLDVVDENGAVAHIPYKANILYEDDMIVMSDNDYYSKPHILLNKVNYGYVDWSELELENRDGNIGIKVAPEDVEVNPSRESIIWSEKTKDKVLARFNEVVDIAASMIQKELQSTDFLQWLKTCYAVSNRYSDRTDIVGRLSKIVDISKAKFKFGPNPNLLFKQTDAMPGLFIREVRIVKEKDASKVTKKKVIRTEFGNFSSRFDIPIFIMSAGERASNLKDKFLFTQYPNGFITIMEPYATLDDAEKDNASEDEKKKMYADDAKFRFEYWEAVKASNGIQVYADIEVPKDFKGTDEEVEETIEEDATPEQIKAIETAKLTAAERRKQAGKTLLYGLRAINGMSTTGSSDGTAVLRKIYEYQKMEIPIANINEWQESEIYYGNENDNELLHFIAFLTRDPEPGNVPGTPMRKHAHNVSTWTGMKYYRKNKDILVDDRGYCMAGHIQNVYQMQSFFDTNIKLFKVAQGNNKLYRDFSRVEEFFMSVQNKTITMSNTLVKWNTARLVKDKLDKAAFLYNFPFNPEFSEMYHKLCTYVNKHYREVKKHSDGTNYALAPETYNDMVSHLDKVYEFQKFVAKSGDDTTGIAELAGVLFGNKELQDGMAVEPEIVAMLDEVLEFSQAVGTMLGYMPILTGYSAEKVSGYDSGRSRSSIHNLNIPEELETELRVYLDSKGLMDYKSNKQLQEDRDRFAEAIGKIVTEDLQEAELAKEQ